MAVNGVSNQCEGNYCLAKNCIHSRPMLLRGMGSPTRWSPGLVNEWKQWQSTVRWSDVMLTEVQGDTYNDSRTEIFCETMERSLSDHGVWRALADNSLEHRFGNMQPRRSSGQYGKQRPWHGSHKDNENRSDPQVEMLLRSSAWSAICWASSRTGKICRCSRRHCQFNSEFELAAVSVGYRCQHIGVCLHRFI